jgi:NADPH:quinone reductase-like Zn-dependent oxidoreductase
MKAVRFHEYGGPEVLRLEEIPKPEPADDEVLVRVHATSVNPIDWKIRAGYLKQLLPYTLPLIPGWDVSGIVESTGPGASKWKPGDAVYGRREIKQQGATAEYIAMKETELIAKPGSLDHVTASAIPLAALTAWQALFDSGGLAAGQTVLVHGAAGGVGHFAVQFAKRKGAHVIATASGRNQDFLRALGADHPVNYQTTRFEDIARDVDVVLDSFAGETRARSWTTLKKGGILVSILGPAPIQDDADRHGVRQALIWAHWDAGQFAEISQLVVDGRVKPHIETILPLAETATAHELNAAGHVRGKVVIQIA